MTPAEYGAYLASTTPPLSDDQAEKVARILAVVESEERAA